MDRPWLKSYEKGVPHTLTYPEITLPEGKTPDQYLADLCWQGLPKYYPDPSPEIKERLESELDVIVKTQFANYFLVVWDIVSFVRSRGIASRVYGSWTGHH